VIPLRDDVPSRTIPVVNYALIAINVFAFVMELGMGQALEGFFGRASVIPALYTGRDHRLEPSEVVTTSLQPALAQRTLSSMFLHGGVLHILGNMLYLWIFGDNVEDRMGHLRYLVFYLLCGWSASYAHIWSDPASRLPSIGASGAIAGVLGAYLVLFPHAKVLTLIPLGFFTDIVRIPAFFVLAFWFLQQFVAGALSLSARTAQTGGVAWWAHIGGFATGLLLVGLFQRRDRRPSARDRWWGERTAASRRRS
jgi:membrane associated rhomboid family serine protease